MSTDAPDLEDVIESDDPELAEQYNRAKEREIEERMADLREQERAAVNALRSDAQDSVETETVELPSGLKLDIRTRFTRRAETLQDELADLEKQNANTAYVRAKNAELLAEMCETDGYDSPEPWEIAAQDDDAGLVWMMEVTDIVTEPIRDKAEGIQGNAKDSASSQKARGDKQSGVFRKR